MPRPGTSFKSSPTDEDSTILQTLPHDPDAERYLIGMALRYPEAALEVARALPPTRFYDPDNARIVQAIRKVVDRGDSPTLIIITTELDDSALKGDAIARLNAFNDLFLPDEDEALNAWARSIHQTWKERTEISITYELAQAGAVGNIAKVRQLTEELEQLRSPVRTLEGEREGEANEGTTWPYSVKDGAIWKDAGLSKAGVPLPPEKLCNFTAVIVAERTFDDGGGTEERYTIQTVCQGRVKTFDMSRELFESEAGLNKIKSEIGARSRVYPSTNVRTLMDAIKALSLEITEQTTYQHTGWRDGRFLLGNGYIDREGWHEEVITQLPELNHPDHYCLKPASWPPYAATPDGDLAQAVACFDQVLKIVPDSVMVPLMGSVLLGPLIPFLGNAKRSALHLIGKNGSYKTSVAEVCVSLFGGGFIGKPTDSWRSTPYQIEMGGYHLKDCPFILDDYKKAVVDQKKVIGLLQNYGDGTGRRRLDKNANMKGGKPFRATLISTGEDRPEGEASVIARMLMVRMDMTMVDLPLLTRMQKEAPQRLHPLAIAWLTWLSGADISPDLDRFDEERAKLVGELQKVARGGNPGRVANNIACLVASWQSFCRFLVEKGLWSAERAATWLKTVKTELDTLSRLQIKATATERYSELFLNTLRSLIASGRCVLQDRRDPDPQMFSNQTLVGAIDSKGVYLITDIAYSAVVEQLKRQGQDPQFSKDALAQMLQEDGLIVERYGDTLMVRRRINGDKPWCWYLPVDIFDRDDFTKPGSQIKDDE